jgi:hypothetical protein
MASQDMALLQGARLMALLWEFLTGWCLSAEKVI